MIVADENVHTFIIRSLRMAGYDVLSVMERYRSISDTDVIHLATQYGYMLLTEDKDFGEWVFANRIRGLSVLFLRYRAEDVREVTRSVLSLLEEQILRNSFFATITTQKIRLKQL